MEGGRQGRAVGAGIAGARGRREGVRTAPETRRGMGEVAGRARRSRRGGLGSQRRGRCPEGGAPPPPPGCGHYDYFGRQGASADTARRRGGLRLFLSLARSLSRRPAPLFQPSGRAKNWERPLVLRGSLQTLSVRTRTTYDARWPNSRTSSHSRAMEALERSRARAPSGRTPRPTCSPAPQAPEPRRSSRWARRTSWADDSVTQGEGYGKS